MKRHTSLKLGVAAAAALSVAAPVAAQAQDTGVMNDEIVVTARKREESLQEVPISITAVNQETLVNRGVNELIDLQRQVPGMQIATGTASASSAVVIIRGQGQADTLLTTDSSVGIYVDGVYNPRSLGLSSILQDVERVEVLRGPQGTLFGRNTTGGAINILTQRANSELGGSIRAIVGDYNTVDLAGVLNVPLGPDAGLRFYARRSQRDGFAEDFNGRDLNDEDLSYFRTRFDLAATPDLDISLSADYARTESGGPAIQLAGVNPFDTAAAAVAASTCLCVPGPVELAAAAALLSQYAVDGGLDRANGTGQLSQAESWSVSSNIAYDLTDGLTIRSITGYRELRKRDVEDLDGTPILLLEPDLRADYEFFSQEFQLLGGTDAFDWVVGAYVSNEEGNDGSVTTAVPAVNPANPNVFDADVTNSSWAVFGQATWQLAERWSLTGGLRYTEEDKEMVSRNHLIVSPFQGAPPIAAGPFCMIDPAQLDDPAICQASFSNTFEDTSWLVSLDYDVTDDVLAYVSASRGFRGGGQNLRGTPASGSFDAYEPEVATNYEVGLKSSSFNGRLVANAAVFMTNYEDIQRSIIVPGVPPATVVGNAAEATLTGGELELTWTPIDPLTLGFTAAYLNGEYDTYMDGALDRSNDPWPAPEWTYSASARYVVPLEVGDLAFQVDYSHADGIGGTSASTSPGLAPFLRPLDTDLVNGRISLDIDSINGQVAIFGRNLADEDYYVTRLAVLGLATQFAGYPRFIGAELRLRFGGEAD